MPIRVVCPCGKTLNAPDEAAGKKARCPNCQHIVDVPIPTRPGEPPALQAEVLPDEPQAPTDRTYAEEIASAFTYPLTTTGTGILVAVALCNFVGTLLGVFGLALIILVNFYLAAYFFTIIQSSAGGTRLPPRLPDATDLWDDLIKPLVMMLAAAIVSAMPWLVYVIWTSGSKTDPNALVLGLLSAWASIYFPMAILGEALSGSLAALSPHVVLPAIFRIPGPYFLMAIFVWLVWEGFGYAQAQIGDTWIGGFVSFVALVYLSWVIARIIGITHWVYRKELGWFQSM